MLDKFYRTPDSTRPKYALGAQNDPTEAGNPKKKAALVGLMAVAAGLLFVLPDGDSEVVAVSAAAPEVSVSSVPDVPSSTTSTSYLQEVSSGSASVDDGALSVSLDPATISRLAQEAVEAANAVTTTEAPSTTAAHNHRRANNNRSPDDHGGSINHGSAHNGGANNFRSAYDYGGANNCRRAGDGGRGCNRGSFG